MIGKGIEVAPLLESKIFLMDLFYDEWPQNHENPSRLLKRYNDNIFMIRYAYTKLFPELVSEVPKQVSTSKINKIKYQLNLLPMVDELTKYDEFGQESVENKGVSIIGTLSESDELEIFDSVVVQTLIKYKWMKYGRAHHLFSSFMHLLYFLIFTYYVKRVYLDRCPQEEHTLLSYILGAGIVYPGCYELIQMWKGGCRDYFSDAWNYTDALYISAGAANCFLQVDYGRSHIVC